MELGRIGAAARPHRKIGLVCSAYAIMVFVGFDGRLRLGLAFGFWHSSRIIKRKRFLLKKKKNASASFEFSEKTTTTNLNVISRVKAYSLLEFKIVAQKLPT